MVIRKEEVDRDIRERTYLRTAKAASTLKPALLVSPPTSELASDHGRVDG